MRGIDCEEGEGFIDLREDSGGGGREQYDRKLRAAADGWGRGSRPRGGGTGVFRDATTGVDATGTTRGRGGGNFGGGRSAGGAGAPPAPPRPDVCSYNHCIAACRRAGKWGLARLFFLELMSRGLRPDGTTVKSALLGCEEPRRRATAGAVPEDGASFSADDDGDAYCPPSEISDRSSPAAATTATTAAEVTTDARWYSCSSKKKLFFFGRPC